MSNLLIIGAGGVGRVATMKCLEAEEFDSVTLASRTEHKCEAIAQACSTSINISQLDASRVENVAQFIEKCEADIVLNVALPYQNMPIMEACAEKGVHYIDTAVPETPERLYINTSDDDWYGPQWALHKEFCGAESMAVLGAGSDPGMVNAFCAYAARELLDRIDTIDIFDVNAGDHGRGFATNFNPEINLREVQAPAHFYESGVWREVPALSVGNEFDFPEKLGRHEMFLMDHDELHSLYRMFPDARHIKFWMGFSKKYRRHFEVLNEIGLLSHEPVSCPVSGNGTVEVVPLKLLKQLLPDPSSLAETYIGKTCIGCLLSGMKNGVIKKIFVYNICDHQDAFQDVGSQAISFTAGTCAAAAAVLIAREEWRGAGVYNVENLPYRPFLDCMTELGMPHDILEL